MVNKITRNTLTLFLLVDFLLVVVTNVWLFAGSYDFENQQVEILDIVWFVFLLILWNSIPAGLGCILWMIGLKKKSIFFFGGTIGYTVLGIGSHFIFQLNLLFNLDGLNEYAGHGGIMYVVSTVVGLALGIIGFLLGSMIVVIWSRMSDFYEIPKL